MAAHMHQAKALLRARLKIAGLKSAVKVANSEQATAALQSAERTMVQTDEALKQSETLAGERLALALQLLYEPRVAARLSDADARQRECSQLMPALHQVGSCLRQAKPLRYAYGSLHALVQYLSGNETNESLVLTIRSYLEQTHAQLANLHEGLSRTAYPFEHARKELSLSDYLLESLPHKDDLGGVYSGSEQMLDGLTELYGRLLGRLAATATAVEAALGLAALPDPAASEAPESVATP